MPDEEGLDEKIAEWRKKYAPTGVAVMKTPLGTMVFRPPEPDEYGSWIDRTTADKASKAAADLELAQMCCIHPAEPEAKALFRRFPVAPRHAMEAILKLGG